MFPTAEVRWFWQGEVPNAALTWLTAQPGDAPSKDTRTDHYLLVNATDTLGVKLREGNIELKQRMEPPRIESLADRAQGLVELWTKWSFDLARERSVLHQLTDSPTWIGIKKTRWLKAYRVTDQGNVEPLPKDEDPTQLCTVEITRVTALPETQRDPWWTLGLEASGNETRLIQTLIRTAAGLLDASFPAAMTTENSHSYPQWLRLPHSTETGT